MGVALWPEEVDALVPANLFDENGVQRARADVEYQHDPIGWAVDVLGVARETLEWARLPEYRGHKWDGTVDPLACIARELAAGNDVGVESATGTGKTYLAAILGLWFVACFLDSIVVTTAPKKDQLTKLLWKEIGRHWRRFRLRYPWAEKIELAARMRPGDADQETWAIVGFACGVDADENSATRAQGFHAEHMLVITEETPGIDAAVMTALGNTRTGKHNLHLALGNPDNQLDALHTFCLRPSVVAVRISALDHPNVVCGRTVIPGAASPEGIARIEETFPPGTPMWESRVRGVSPKESSEALIKYEWCERAALLYVALKGAPIDGEHAMGVDVANSTNGDKAAIARWQGRVLTDLRSFQCPNANQLGRDVVSEMERDKVLGHYVGIDPIGVGAGAVNSISDAGAYVQRLNGALPPVKRAQKAPDGALMAWAPDSNAFSNLRSQMWWQLREDLRLGRVAIPDNALLFAQLTTPRYKVHGGKTIVESKEDIRKRANGQSPDEADAVVYGNWVRKRTGEEQPLVIDKDRHPGWDLHDKHATRKKIPHAVDQFEERGRGRLVPSFSNPRRG